jgi:hypothetical protein
LPTPRMSKPPLLPLPPAPPPPDAWHIRPFALPFRSPDTPGPGQLDA